VNVRENVVRADRFYVRFTTFDHDMLVNRILAAALEVLGAVPLNGALRARVLAARALFPSLTPWEVTPAAFGRLGLGRSTARYREALVLARMILEQQAPDLLAGRERVSSLHHALLEGSYRPGMIRRVWIPKAGGGQRGLGIPNVVDRIVQQAVHQVLSPQLEQTFHDSSHGFRPGRSCHTAVAAAAVGASRCRSSLPPDLRGASDASSPGKPSATSMSRRAGCGPTSPVPWEGSRGNPGPLPDRRPRTARE
jgi:hypothetical protein